MPSKTTVASRGRSRPEAAARAPISLPVVGARAIRPSKSGKRRAAVLIVVHVLIALHVAHWLASGSTVTPVEPSEAIQFSVRGIVNAGLIFFGLAIASTLVLGRWFCGWACHVVALQDLSRYILGKLGLRPKPARLGLLGVVPLLAFLYMFAAPLVFRLLRGDAVTVHHLDLTTDAFWETFPPLIPAVLTFLTCGFFAVYLLGSKGFCTYGCPYGAIFGVVDQLAPWRIRVTEDCDGSGHCTGVCSSNVRVHQEVRDFGMVVDPGCMKCLDCVSVCPNDALYFGPGTPAVLARSRKDGSRPGIVGAVAGLLSPSGLMLAVFSFAALSVFMWFDGELDLAVTGILTGATVLVAAVFAGRSTRLQEYSRIEQAILGVAFLVSMVIFRGLYSLVPFLFALGLAGVLAFLTVHALRLASRRELSLHRWVLKRAGRLRRAGYGFIAFMLGLGVLTAHSAVVQYHLHMARRSFAHVSASADADEARGHAAAALRHGEAADRIGFFSQADNQLRLARLHRFNGDMPAYEQGLRDVIALMQHDATLPVELGDFLLESGREEEAVQAYQLSIDRRPRSPLASQRLRHVAVLHFDSGVREVMEGRLEAALARFARAVEVDGTLVEARENLAGTYCLLGRFDEGAREFEEALRLNPDDADTEALTAQAYLGFGDLDAAERHVRRAIALVGEHPDLLALLGEIERLRASPPAERTPGSGS